MFVEWLKYTYLVDHSGSTICKREYENYHLNSHYSTRQDISEAYEIKSIQIIDDMKTQHQQQIIDYERNMKKLSNRISETTQEIEVSYKRISELEDKVTVQNIYEEMETAIYEARGFCSKFDPNSILTLDFANEIDRKVINKLSFIKLPEIKGLT